MIAYIKGIIADKYVDKVIIDNHGIGYEVFVSDTAKYNMGDEVKLFIYEHIREDADLLFGFLEKSELTLFNKLISVKGIGPKIALNAIGKGGCASIIEAIEKGDATYLKSLPGIGAKASSQIVLDLKGKLVLDETTNNIDANLNDAIEGLKALGYKTSEINLVMKQMSLTNASVDEYMKEALKIIATNKGV